MKLTEKGPVYFELYGALAHFVGRQHLAVQAVIDQGVNPADLAWGVSGWYDKTPQAGRWGPEWAFFFHGGGCQITHIETGEPVDWNGPDPLSFDPYFFVRHLEWRLEHESGLPLLREFIKQRGAARIVVTLIDDLVADGIISKKHCLNPAVTNASESP